MTRMILLLPSVDGDDYTSAVLTPEGMGGAAALDLADQVLTALEDEEAEARRKDRDAEDTWDLERLHRELEAVGFTHLQVITGPTWDRHGA